MEEEANTTEETNEKKESTETESQKIEKIERSTLSLEGGKEPLSIYTRRIIDISKIQNYLKEDSTHGLCGGKNLGNTCFMNSSIACLSNCTELTCYFLSGDYKKDINKENHLGMGGALAESWGNLLNQYWVENTRVGNPSEFKRVIGNKVKIFRGFGQQDSNEFMNFVFDYLNEDLNGTTKKPYIEIESKKDDETDENCAKRFWDCNLKRNDSIITDLFCGQYKSTITCPDCGNINITFDPFYTLTLPVADKNFEKNKKFDYLDEFHLFYVPKFAIRKPVRIIIKNIIKNINLDEVFKNLGNKRDFIYKDLIDELFYVNIINKKLKNFIEDISEIEDHTDDFIFCYDVIDELENIKIPLYFKDSEFPRIISGTSDMTFDDLRKKMYFYLRKYIYSPLISLDEISTKDTVTQEIQKFIHNMKIEEDKIFELIGDEYENIFKNAKIDENAKKYLNDFIADIPFKIYLQEKNDNNKIIPIIDNNNFFILSKELNEILGINAIDEKLVDKFSLLNNYEIIVDFQYESKYLNNKEMKLNSCLCYKTDFKNVALPQPKKSGRITLEDCLNNFCQEEKLEKGNEWYCPKCKKHTLVKKKMELFYLPKILIICLKRFIKMSYKWRKNEEYIDFPINNLNMGEFMVGPDKSHSKYDLFAVSQHYGSILFGHYTAVCKNFDKWYSYNDSSIHLCSENDTKSSAAYVIFYRRQTD